MASVISNKKEAQDWNNSVIGLADKINQRFYDDTKGYYYDKLLGKQEPVAVEGPEGWIPLWAGIATKEQAGTVTKVMMNVHKFNTKVPLPTLTADRRNLIRLKVTGEDQYG